MSIDKKGKLLFTKSILELMYLHVKINDIFRICRLPHIDYQPYLAVLCGIKCMVCLFFSSEKSVE